MLTDPFILVSITMFRGGYIVLLTATTLVSMCGSSNILMLTMGGSKSHKIPFWELARGLAARGHNITFISGFPPDTIIPGVEEITPASLVFYIQNFTNWDLIGNRMRGEEPLAFIDIVRYPFQACEMLLSDPETKDFLRSNHSYDLLVLDGMYPECTLGFTYHFTAPFIYINTMGFYVGTLSLAGNPSPYSFTPYFARAFTNSMSFIDRFRNTGFFLVNNIAHKVMMQVLVQKVLRNHFGPEIPDVYEMSKNVSFILQNAHVSLSYPRPYLPNVAEVACMHCKSAKSLPKDLEDFINGGDNNGFIYVSMGSAIKAEMMPEYLRLMFIRVFEQLPYRVLWKWESAMLDLPDNVKISRWLPQQDLLGHRKIHAFITHSGIHSMSETVYHGVPVVTMPVCFDQEANAAKAELDGYAIKLELQTINAETLLWSIKKVIDDPQYLSEVKKRQILLRDQKESPLERAVYWTEYVLRYNGAYHLQSPAKDMNLIQYYLVDIIILYVVLSVAVLFIGFYLLKFLFSWLTDSTKINLSVVKSKNKVQ